MATIPTDAIWHKSSRSAVVANCVEVAVLPDAVAVRDSKNRSGPALSFTPPGWLAFLEGVKASKFDLPTI
ncbi:DUF397 domain-containing protein [Actinoplanes xinjiangensis]|uniref:DUF397 domain-containing protein n=1 Tax=Actinoplanes xinjiangensis TaxID=512350 RepID=UPI00343A5F1C